MAKQNSSRNKKKGGITVIVQILFHSSPWNVKLILKNLRTVRIHRAMDLHVKAKQKALIGRRKRHK